jgi:hypothetical protein
MQEKYSPTTEICLQLTLDKKWSSFFLEAIMTTINFPPGENGKISTMEFSKKVWAASIDDIDPAQAAEIEKQPNWRAQYSKYVEKHVRACLQSPNNSIKMAKAGLNYIHDRFQYQTADGTIYPLSNFSSISPSFTFHTGMKHRHQ